VIRLAILGSTGSIGRSTLEVVRRHPERFRVVGLSARTRIRELAGQVAEFKPEVAVISDDDVLRGADATDALPAADWRGGRDEVVSLAGREDVDVVVNALVGAAGLEPSLVALRSGKRLALANKESLVTGGPLVLAAVAEGGGELVPIDSEHSAILQCMEGAQHGSVTRLVLTASGGPFRGWSPERLQHVRPRDALRHPTWDMGAKITVDSATLANKALEVIEAHFLYGMEYDAIDVVVHPQSIVHSFVEFVDGSVLAQMGLPTMELPILYALCYPGRVSDGVLRTFDPIRSSPLTFEAVDHDTFPLFGLGVAAGRRGGASPAVFNAGNEIAVQAFLEERIRFPDIERVVSTALERVDGGPPESVAAVLEVDREARALARGIVKRLSRP
jgi:1-deoxy-D-xylulose-5-phosphate reductoisomerase